MVQQAEKRRLDAGSLKGHDSRPCFAVDIDNVLAQAEREVQRLFEEISHATWPRGKYGSAGGLDEGDLNREVVEQIFSRFHEQSIPRLPVVPGAKMAIDRLRERYRIIIVTARRPTSRPQTLTWLQAHRIHFDALYHAEDKTDLPERIHLAVDDHPAHVQGYCEMGLRVFVMDQPWNRTFTHPLAERVRGWDELIQVLHYGSLAFPNRFTGESPAPPRLLSARVPSLKKPSIEAAS